MDWEFVLREEGKQDDVRIMSADNVDPQQIIVIDGREWQYSGDEPTGDSDVPIRVFFVPHMGSLRT